MPLEPIRSRSRLSGGPVEHTKGGNVTLNYTNNFRDSLYFNIQHFLRSPSFLLFIAICGFGGWFLVRDMSDALLVMVILSILVFVFLMVQGFVIMVITVVINYSRRKNKSYLAAQTLTIGPEGIIEQNEYGKLEVKWSAVPKVVKTRRLLLIYRHQNGAILVPNRVFQSRPEADAFYSDVLKYWQSCLRLIC